MESDTREDAAWLKAPEYNWQSPTAATQFLVKDLTNTEPGFFFRSARWLVPPDVGVEILY